MNERTSRAPIPERGGATLLGAVAVALAIAWTSVVVYVAHGSMTFNPMTLPMENRISLRVFFPEGWKFFTRNAQEESKLLFRRDNSGTWSGASLGPNGLLRNFLGLSRRPRAQGTELGLLLEKIPSGQFHKCDDAPTMCLERAPVASRLVNIRKDATLCGTVGIVYQRPIPWAWARSSDTIVMPSRVAKVEVQCSA